LLLVRQAKSFARSNGARDLATLGDLVDAQFCPSKINSPRTAADTPTENRRYLCTFFFFFSFVFFWKGVLVGVGDGVPVISGVGDGRTRG
jgi:hypothetical protein